jgi:hypothetical protein
MTLLPKPPKRGPKPKKRIPRGKRPAKRSAKKTLLRRLKAKAWKVFSVWVRSHNAWAGQAQCYACLEWFPWEAMHAAHFFHGKLDFDEMNVRACCCSCNTYKHGNLGLYGFHLAQDFGLPAIEALRLRANTHPGYTIEELEAIIAKYSKEP